MSLFKFDLPPFDSKRRRNMKLWSFTDLRRLRELAEQGVEPSMIAKDLRRSVPAIRHRASRHGISLTAVKTSNSSGDRI